MKAMWVTDPGEGADFSGERYEIEDAHCEPGPVQDPHPPILVGGTGEEVTLKLVANHADVWNTGVFTGDPDTLSHKIGVIEDHCETVERDPTTSSTLGTVTSSARATRRNSRRHPSFAKR